MQDVETIDEFCPKNCVYRMKLDRHTSMCGYAIIEQHTRGCAISSCDKYRKGKRKCNYQNMTEARFTLEDEDI